MASERDGADWARDNAFRDWLDHRLADTEQRLLEHARGVRAEMRLGFDKVDHTAMNIDERARLLTDRVTSIEAERRMEERESVKKGAIAGLIGAGLLQACVQVLRHLVHW